VEEDDLVVEQLIGEVVAVEAICATDHAAELHGQGRQVGRMARAPR
jgi:hypothetical protein